MASKNTDPDNAHRGPRWVTFAVWQSPLARSADRTEAGLLLVVVTLWLLALPVLATAASITWSQINATATEQQQTRTMTTARLLTDVPEVFYPSGAGTPVTPSATVGAQWTAPDGRQHTGSVVASSGARTGDQQLIWLDKSGNLADPPLTTGTAAALTIGATVGSWLVWGFLLISSFFAVRWRLNIRRAQDWDQQWETIEPVWSGR